MTDSRSIVVRNDELMSAPVDRELVFLIQATDSYVCLDEIGVRIWELLDQPQRITDLVSQLCEEFDAPLQTVTADVLAFLSELEGEGMISAVDHDR